MKKSRFTDSQILAILKQAEARTPVAELCRMHGKSNASFHKCHRNEELKQHSGLSVLLIRDR